MVEDYYKAVTGMLEGVMQTQLSGIREAGRLGAAAIRGGGLIHTFGTGHSHLLAEELFARAGGLLLVNAIFEPSLMLHEGVQRSSALERLPGYAEQVLATEPLAEGDLLIIISNSGRNAVPVEAAMYARRHGVKVAAVTSLAHSQSQPPNHDSGQRLFELADVVIDNGGVPGDAVVDVPGSAGVRACGTSTVVGGFIMQAIAAAVVEELAAAGAPVPILRSGNVEGSKAQNQALRERYAERIQKIRAYLG